MNFNKGSGKRRQQALDLKVIVGSAILIGLFLSGLLLVFAVILQVPYKPSSSSTAAATPIPLTVVFSTPPDEIINSSQSVTGNLSDGVASTSISQATLAVGDQGPYVAPETFERELAVTPVPTADYNISFTLPALDGTTVSFPDHYGSVTIFLAGAAGCPTCAIEGAYLSKLQTEYGSQGLRVFVVDISPYDTSEFLQDWVEMVGQQNLTWVFDDGRRFSNRFNVLMLDTTIILDADGRQIFRDEVVSSEVTLRTVIERAFIES